MAEVAWLYRTERGSAGCLTQVRMMIIRGIHRVFRVELSIQRYRAQFCNGLRTLIYHIDPLPGKGRVFSISAPSKLQLLAEFKSDTTQADVNWEAVSYRHDRAGNLASIRVIEVKRARVRKLVFQKTLDRIGALSYTRRVSRSFELRTVRKNFQC